MKKDKTQEVILVITTGFLLLFAIYKKEWMLFVALGVGLIGVFIKPLAALIAKAWFKLGDLLGFIVSKVILALLFYILLVPVSFLYNIFNKDTLDLKRQTKSMWHQKDHQYVSNDLNNSW
jgi:hypothetical protein